MRGNIVVAAALLGLGILLGCGVLVLGARWALVGAADRLAASVDRHGELTQSAGQRAGEPIQSALDRLGNDVAKHAAVMSEAGRAVSTPRVTMLGPVPITDHVPLRVQGTRGDDQSIPVDVQLQGKGK